MTDPAAAASRPAAVTARGLLASSVVAVAAISVVALVAHVLTAPLDHDEHMYVAAGVLWPERHLYSDFLYFQTPYLPVLYSALFGAAHVERLLFAARLFTAVVTVASALLVGGVAWRLGRDMVAAAAAVLLFCASPAVQNAVGQASNYAAPMAASMCACALLLLPAKRRPLALAGCGAALGVAIGLKLYYATLVVPIAASVWIAPEGHGRHRLLLPFFAGLGVAVAPAAFLVLRDPVAGWFANVGYHTLNTQWWAASGWDVSITLRERVAFARWLLSAPAHRLCAAAIVLAGAGAGWHTRARLRETATSEPVWAAATCGALMATAALTALVPSPSWPQVLRHGGALRGVAAGVAHRMHRPRSPCMVRLGRCVRCAARYASDGTGTWRTPPPVGCATGVDRQPGACACGNTTAPCPRRSGGSPRTDPRTTVPPRGRTGDLPGARVG